MASSAPLSQASLYYQSSGRMPFKVIILSVLLMPLAVLSGWFYAWLTFHFALEQLTPLLGPVVHIVHALADSGMAKYFFLVVFIKSILTLGLGVLLFVPVFIAILGGKSRNPKWMGRIGFLFGLLGWYSQWSAWLAMLVRAYPSMATAGISANMFDFALHPAHLFDLAVSANHTGIYSSGSFEGFWLWLVWLVETIIIISMPAMMAKIAALKPFCEASNTWIEAVDLPKKFAFINDTKQFIQSLETHPANLLSLLRDRTNSDSSSIDNSNNDKSNNDKSNLGYATLQLYRCEGGKDAYISVINTAVKIEKDKEKKSERTIVEYLRIPFSTASYLMFECKGEVQMPRIKRLPVKPATHRLLISDRKDTAKNSPE